MADRSFSKNAKAMLKPPNANTKRTVPVSLTDDRHDRRPFGRVRRMKSPAFRSRIRSPYGDTCVTAPKRATNLQQFQCLPTAPSATGGQIHVDRLWRPSPVNPSFHACPQQSSGRSCSTVLVRPRSCCGAAGPTGLANPRSSPSSKALPHFPSHAASYAVDANAGAAESVTAAAVAASTRR